MPRPIALATCLLPGLTLSALAGAITLCTPVPGEAAPYPSCGKYPSSRVISARAARTN